MSWPLRLLDPPPSVEDLDALRPGDCWYAQRGTDGRWQTVEAGDAWPLRVTDQPREGDRPPLVVAFPSPSERWCWPCVFWCLDGPSSSGGGWQITGTPPHVTVSPSIAIHGVYHGWIRDGVLSADVDGRTYPHLERR